MESTPRKALAELSCNVPLPNDENACVRERGMKRRSGTSDICNRLSEASMHMDRFKEDMGVVNQFVRVTLANNKAQRTMSKKGTSGERRSTTEKLKEAQRALIEAEITNNERLDELRADLSRKSSALEEQTQKCEKYELTLAELRSMETHRVELEEKIKEWQHEVARREELVAVNTEERQNYVSTLAELRLGITHAQACQQNQLVELQNSLKLSQEAVEAERCKREAEELTCAELRQSLSELERVGQTALEGLRAELAQRDSLQALTDDNLSKEETSAELREVRARVVQLEAELATYGEKNAHETESELRQSMAELERVGQAALEGLRAELAARDDALAEMESVGQTALEGLRTEIVNRDNALQTLEEQLLAHETTINELRLAASKSKGEEMDKLKSCELCQGTTDRAGHLQKIQKYESEIAELRLVHSAQVAQLEAEMAIRIEQEANHRANEVEAELRYSYSELESVGQAALDGLRNELDLRDNALQSINEEHEAALAALRSEFQTRLSQLEGELAAQVELLSQAQETEADLRQSLRELESVGQAALEGLREELMQRDSALQTLTDQHTAHEATIAGLRSTQEGSEVSPHQELQQRVQELEAQLRHDHDRFAALQQQHEQSRYEWEAQFQQQRLVSEQAHQEAIATRSSQTEESQRAVQELEILQRRVSEQERLIEQLAESRRQCEQLEAACQQLRSAAQLQVAEEFQSLQLQCQTQLATIAELRQFNERMQLNDQELANKCTQVAELEQRCSEYEASIADMRQMAEQEQASLQCLSDELVESRQKCEELEGMCRKLRSDFSEQQAGVSETLQSLQQRCQDYEAALTELRSNASQVTVTQEDSTQTKAQIDALQKQCQQSLEELSQVKERLQIQQDELTRRDGQIGQLEQQSREYEATIAELRLQHIARNIVAEQASSVQAQGVDSTMTQESSGKASKRKRSADLTDFDPLGSEVEVSDTSKSDLLLSSIVLPSASTVTPSESSISSSAEPISTGSCSTATTTLSTVDSVLTSALLSVPLDSFDLILASSLITSTPSISSSSTIDASAFFTAIPSPSISSSTNDFSAATTISASSTTDSILPALSTSSVSPVTDSFALPSIPTTIDSSSMGPIDSAAAHSSPSVALAPSTVSVSPPESPAPEPAKSSANASSEQPSSSSLSSQAPPSFSLLPAALTPSLSLSSFFPANACPTMSTQTASMSTSSIAAISAQPPPIPATVRSISFSHPALVVAPVASATPATSTSTATRIPATPVSRIIPPSPAAKFVPPSPAQSRLVPPSPASRMLRPSRTVPPPPARVLTTVDAEKEKLLLAQKKAAEEYAFKPRRSLAQEHGTGTATDTEMLSSNFVPAEAFFGFEDADAKLGLETTPAEAHDDDNATRRPKKWIAPFKSAAVEATPKKTTVVQSSIPKCRVKKPGEEDFEDVLKLSEIKINEVSLDMNQAKLLKAEVKKVREVLKDMNKDWQIRVKALVHLSDMMTNEGLTTIPGWQDEALALQPMLAANLQDLRSGVITVACKALVVMAQLMGESFDEHMCFFLPILFKSLYVTIKVISVSADQCSQALLARCHSSKYIPQLVAGCADSHSITRAKCTQYLASFLAQSSAQPFPEVVKTAHCSRVSLVITTNMGDSDKDVRAATRGLFEAFEIKFPLLAQKIFEEFPAQTQKAIMTERQQKNVDAKKRKSDAISKPAH